MTSSSILGPISCNLTLLCLDATFPWPRSWVRVTLLASASSPSLSYKMHIIPHRRFLFLSPTPSFLSSGQPVKPFPPIRPLSSPPLHTPFPYQAGPPLPNVTHRSETALGDELGDVLHVPEVRDVLVL